MVCCKCYKAENGTLKVVCTASRICCRSLSLPILKYIYFMKCVIIITTSTIIII